MKKFFQKISDWVRNALGKQYQAFKDNAALAVQITEKVKAVVDSPVTDIITAIIPGELDNQIAFQLRGILKRLATEMAIAKDLVESSKSNADSWAAIIAHLRDMIPDGRAGFWIEFSGRLNQALADGQLSLPEAVMLTQLIYAEMQKNK